MSGCVLVLGYLITLIQLVEYHFYQQVEHSYKQAPYQEISKEEYESWVSKMPDSIRWDMLSLYETTDGTTGSQELSCVAGACEIVDITR